MDAPQSHARPAALGRADELHEVINAAAAMPRSRGVGGGEIYGTAVRELLVHGHSDLAKTFATEFLSFLKAEPATANAALNGMIAGRYSSDARGCEVAALMVA